MQRMRQQHALLALYYSWESQFCKPLSYTWPLSCLQLVDRGQVVLCGITCIEFVSDLTEALFHNVCILLYYLLSTMQHI